MASNLERVVHNRGFYIYNTKWFLTRHWHLTGFGITWTSEYRNGPRDIEMSLGCRFYSHVCAIGCSSLRSSQPNELHFIHFIHFIQFIAKIWDFCVFCHFWPFCHRLPPTPRAEHTFWRVTASNTSTNANGQKWWKHNFWPQNVTFEKTRFGTVLRRYAKTSISGHNTLFMICLE